MDVVGSVAKFSPRESADGWRGRWSRERRGAEAGSVFSRGKGEPQVRKIREEVSAARDSPRANLGRSLLRRYELRNLSA